MFDVSFSELVLILVVGLLVFGPEKLPEVIRTTTRWIAKMRSGFTQVRNEIEREAGLDELKREIHNQSIIDSFKDVQNDLRGARRELEQLPYDVSDIVQRNEHHPSAAPAADTTPAAAAPIIPPNHSQTP